MKMFIYKTTIMFLLLCRINVVFSQEWQCSIVADDLEYYDFLDQITELSNGNLLIPTGHYIRESTQEYWYSLSPAVTLLSEDGEILAQNNFFRPGYCTMSINYTFENNGNKYLLTTYSPEHSTGSFNHFENYDNPPSDAKLVLMKLDDQLNVEESYEHSWPIDTYEDHGGSWEIYPNGFSGNIYLFTAFEEDDNIVGAYWKSVSFDNPSRGDDTLFFFRMNFDGEILNRKAVEIVEGKGTSRIDEKDVADERGLRTNRFRGDHFVSTDYGYIFYMSGDGTDAYSYLGAGRAMYYDKDFNHITTKYVRFNDPLGKEILQEFNVRRSNHSTTYLSATKRRDLDGSTDEFCRLYEIDDDIDSDLHSVKIVKQISRESGKWDQPSYLSSVDLIDDNSLCYIYVLEKGFFDNLDSYIVIEHLDNDLNTISTLYYGVGNIMLDMVYNIKKTKDGVIIIHDSYTLDHSKYITHITKFPASAFGFENIEEAHAHNLHLAVAYPNPGGDVMNIRTSLRNCTLQVYDMQGRMVHQQEITDEITSIDASNWTNGTYIWELGTGNGNENGNGSGNENGNGSRILESGKWVK